MLLRRLFPAPGQLFRCLAVTAALSTALAVAPPLLAADSAAAAKSDTFDILEFRVLGNHVLPATTIEDAVYPFLGPARTLDTVRQAVAKLETAYKDAGFGAVFVDIPEQQVADGVVRLKVTEGVVEHVRVHGDRYFSNRQLLAALPALKTANTPNLPALQQQLTQLNAVSADRSVVPLLKAGALPGTVDVDLNVKDMLPLHGSVSYDNRHTADTTPNRATLAASYDNLWQRQDSLALQYQTAPARMKDAEVLVASYTGHVGETRDLAAFSYIHSNSNVLAVNTLGVLGQGSIYGAHWIRPLPAAGNAVQTLNLGAEYKDVLTQVLPDTSGSTAGGAVTTQVRYVNWSALYSGNWYGDARSFGLTAGVGFGVRSLANTVSEFQNVRYNANPDYIYVRAGLNASQALPLGLNLTQRINGQWANSPLVNNEQFALGGADSVRGYFEAETLGDSGATATLELHSPPLGGHGPAFLAPLYFFGFADAGVITLVNPLPSQRPSQTLDSAGVGLRLEGARGLGGSFDYAVPLRDGVRTRKDDARVDFSLQFRF